MSDKPELQTTQPPVAAKQDLVRKLAVWNPWLGMLFVIITFFLAQAASLVIMSLYTTLRGMTGAQANDWLAESTVGQFAFMSIVTVMIVGSVYFFLKLNNSSLRAIGIRKPKWKDLWLGLLAVPVYFVLYFISLIVVSYLFPSFNVSQEQDVGFNSVQGTVALILAYISLAILPPISEEILTRGLFYSSAKKAMPVVLAAGVTSLLFAVAHLPEGSDGAPLYVAAVDTFILSLVLIYLREKSGGLWSSMFVHFVKNSVAFLALYIFTS